MKSSDELMEFFLICLKNIFDDLPKIENRGICIGYHNIEEGNIVYGQIGDIPEEEYKKQVSENLNSVLEHESLPKFLKAKKENFHEDNGSFAIINKEGVLCAVTYGQDPSICHAISVFFIEMKKTFNENTSYKLDLGLVTKVGFKVKKMKIGRKNEWVRKIAQLMYQRCLT